MLPTESRKVQMDQLRKDSTVGLKRSMRFLGVIVVMATLATFLTVAPVAAAPALVTDVNVVTQRIIRPDGGQSGGSVYLSGRDFAAGELVSIYATLPDGRVFPLYNLVSAFNPPACCPQSDEVLADGTGGWTAFIRFGPLNATQALPTTLGTLTDGVRYTDTIFTLPGEFAAAVPPIGVYTLSAQGHTSLAKATTTITVNPGPAGNNFGATTTTGTLTILTTIGRQSSAKQTDPDRTDVNPNVDIAANGYIPGEPVSFWATLPDGSVVPFSTIAADDGGTAFIQVELLTGKFPTGQIQFTARGNTSNYVTIGSFLLLPGGILDSRSPGITLTASFLGAPQTVPGNSVTPTLPGFFSSDFLLLTARGYRANETVTFFQTFPDQTVHFIATIRANEAGATVAVLPLFPGPLNSMKTGALGDAVRYIVPYPSGISGNLPVGRHFFTSRGDSSGRTAITSFDILPSQT